jgi:hypothetical protein
MDFVIFNIGKRKNKYIYYNFIVISDALFRRNLKHKSKILCRHCTKTVGLS